VHNKLKIGLVSFLEPIFTTHDHTNGSSPFANQTDEVHINEILIRSVTGRNIYNNANDGDSCVITMKVVVMVVMICMGIDKQDNVMLFCLFINVDKVHITMNHGEMAMLLKNLLSKLNYSYFMSTYIFNHSHL